MVGQANIPLVRWERATGRFRVHSEAEGVRQDTATTFAEDRFGQLWVGLYSGGLLRHWKDHFTWYSESDGLPAGQIRSLHVDHAGRLWIGSFHGGLARIDNPSEPKPRFVTYTTTDGLSDNAVVSLTEDQLGRIYASTGRGIDRLDPATGHIKYYTTADGLVRGEMQAVGHDRQGALWFGSHHGLSRLVPEPDEPAAPPPVLIMGLQVRGVSRQLAEFGQSEVSGLALPPNQNQLRLDFIGLGFAPGERLRYQYRLDGADRDWSPPTELRTINYASLRPGSYTFQVRAVNVEGAVSPQPASVAFTVLAPLWRRWWFLALVAAVVVAAGSALYRLRVGQLLELERVRTRIATDLHDDIGANLSQIAVLSEVAVHDDGAGPTHQTLNRIAEVSRETVQSMSDIVWAVDPEHDRFGDLATRMRRFANDVLVVRNISLQFHTTAEQEIPVAAGLRREIFLIFKECVTNAVRHSGCDAVEVELAAKDGVLNLNVVDNGRGLDPSEPCGGHGLASIRRRAWLLDGDMQIASRPGAGVSIRLRVPLQGQNSTCSGRFFRRLFS